MKISKYIFAALMSTLRKAISHLPYAAKALKFNLFDFRWLKPTDNRKEQYQALAAFFLIFFRKPKFDLIMKLPKYIFAAIIPLLFLASCTEPMDLELDSTFTRLVVEGVITSDPGVHKIRLSKTTDFYDDDQLPPVVGATVMISDGQHLVELTENPYGSGFYETYDGFAGQVGRTYNLMIELDEEIGGHKVYTASDLLRPTAEPDSIQIVFQPAWGSGFWEIKLYAQDPPSRDFYKFLIYVNQMLISDSLQKVFVVDDRLFNGNYTNGIGVGFISAEREDNSLYPGDTVTLMIANLTEEHANFIWTARIESGFNTPLFSGPPANVQGNVSNGAIGFFAAYQPRYVSRVWDGE
jgi:hypothetical protein